MRNDKHRKSENTTEKIRKRRHKDDMRKIVQE